MDTVMTFDWTIEFGDILTSFTILVSVSALIISWAKERLRRETEQADKVRAAGAKALTNLDRWQSLSESFYQELQPLFVEASEILQKDFDMLKARDYLWKKINHSRTQIMSKILDEKISTAYADLLSHFPAIREPFIKTFDQLRVVEEDIYERFMAASQDNVFSFEGKEREYTSADLGNVLRTTAVIHKEELVEKSTTIIRPTREVLFDVIAKTDREILRASRILPTS